MDTTKLNRHNPTRYHLQRLWVMSHFPGEKCIVFINPHNHIEAINKKFNIQPMQLLHSEVFVLPTEDQKAIKLVHTLPEEEFGPIMLWDGQNFMIDNT